MQTNAKNSICQSISKDGITVFQFSADTLLEDVFLHDACPDIIKQVLGESINWLLRNDMKAKESVLHPKLDSRWLATLLALGTLVELDDGSESLLADYLSKSGRRGTIAYIKAPVLSQGQAFGISHVPMTPSDKSIVSAAAFIEKQDGKITAARLAFGGVWQQKVRLAEAASTLVNKTLTTEVINKIADAIKDEIQPIGDYRGSVEYRKHLATVTVKRALEKCQ